MTAEKVTTTAVAKVENTPGAMVRQHAESFTAVLPSHIKPETWVRLAQSALKRGKKIKTPNGVVCTELELAASNNPGVFLGSLLESARLGLEPGTEQYYLTPRKVSGRLEILGIVGYQGYIELMYRAGAISSVVAECVYTSDKFEFRPGVDERPVHEIDWDAEDRGSLRLVYAYAVMKDGATSKVIVMNKAAIEAIKKSSQGSSSQYSPWQNHEAAMWLKSSVRQLAKWVPTSAEYMREQLRIASEVAGERPGNGFAPAVEATGAAPIDITDAWDNDGEILDAEVVVDEPEQPAATGGGEPITTAQLTKLHTMLGKCGVTEPDAKRDDVSTLVGRSLASTKDLTKAEAMTVIDLLERAARDSNPAEALGQIIAELTAAQR